MWAGYAKEKDHQAKPYVYEEGRIMVCLPDERMICGNIRNIVTEGISQIELFKYVQIKAPHWTYDTFGLINWGSIAACMGKMSDQRVTNTIKFAHG